MSGSVPIPANTMAQIPADPLLSSVGKGGVAGAFASVLAGLTQDGPAPDTQVPVRAWSAELLTTQTDNAGAPAEQVKLAAEAANAIVSEIPGPATALPMNNVFQGLAGKGPAVMEKIPHADQDAGDGDKDEDRIVHHGKAVPGTDPGDLSAAQLPAGQTTGAITQTGLALAPQAEMIPVSSTLGVLSSQPSSTSIADVRSMTDDDKRLHRDALLSPGTDQPAPTSEVSTADSSIETKPKKVAVRSDAVAERAPLTMRSETSAGPSSAMLSAATQKPIHGEASLSSSPSSDPVASAPGDALALSPALLAASLDMPFAAPGVAQGAALSANPVADRSAPAEQVVPALVGILKSTDGTQSVTVRLQPPELGHVEIRVDRTAEGTARVDIIAERPATLQLLQRDESRLQQVLDQAGILPNGRSLNFQVAAPEQISASASRPDSMAAGSGDSGQSQSGGAWRQSEDSRRDPGPGPNSDQRQARARWFRAGLDITA